MTIKARFAQFTKMIRPTEKHIEEADRQTDFMIGRLKHKISSDNTYELEKIVLAGSNAKHTSLRKTEQNRFDVDLNACFSGKGATTDDLNKLLQFTRDQLLDIYRHLKDEKDFKVLNSAVRVKFTSGIKLWVDVAPIILDDSVLHVEDAGWIPRPDGWRLTSVTAHNKFVGKRNKQSKEVSGPVHFNRLVRMFKWWNNLQGDLTQPSIFCELVAAAAFAETGVTNEWQSSLWQLFRFMRQHEFKTPILFHDYYTPSKVQLPSHSVIVMDPVNPGNNITAAWTARTRDEFLKRVQQAYNAMMDARSAEQDDDEDEAVDHWCRVFGEDFRSLSEAED
jgi:Second Messenger Oligonucleotide or Dinucleotide Synthetase domain